MSWPSAPGRLLVHTDRGAGPFHAGLLLDLCRGRSHQLERVHLPQVGLIPPLLDPRHEGQLLEELAELR